MDEYFRVLDVLATELSTKYEVKNLISIQDHFDPNCYWNRLANLSFFEKLYNEHRYHFLYEIQGLSSQIHFGILNCLIFKDKISIERGRPNVYNHRYTFMIESTIHGIYSYWNRVGLVLNTYLKKPKGIRQTYFAGSVDQLVIDYPDLAQNKYYQWIFDVKIALEELNRNEFAHNNSLIMQNFLPKNNADAEFDKLLAMPELLLLHNKSIVPEIYHLVELLENLEKIVNA